MLRKWRCAIKIKYCGGRSRYEVSYERKGYHFTPENNHILDIQDQKIINYIFSMPNRAEFEAVMEETQPIPPQPVEEVKKEVIKKPIKSKKHKGGK